MYKIISLSLIFSLSGAQAFAANKEEKMPSFLSVNQLNAKARDCFDNDFYAEAGIIALENVDKAIAAKSKLAAALMKKSQEEIVDANGAKQTKTFSGSKADYGISEATLAYLLLVIDEAKKNVNLYLNNIIFPEDADAPEEIIGPIEQFLNDSPCYAENRNILEYVLKDLDSRAEELKAAQAASSALKAATGDGEQAVDSASPNTPNAANMKSQNTATNPTNSKKTKYKASDISGTEEEKNKGTK